jgi:uncharacterized protein YcbX
MARIGAALAAGGITLNAPGRPPIFVPTPAATAPLIESTIWRDSVPARLAGADANAWISEALGEVCRLVHLADTAARPIDPAHARPGETVSFADGFPLLLTSLASLADLNHRLAVPVPITRFRGNLVIAGAAPWAEDRWQVIRIGSAIFRVAKPCERCLVTTIDQRTGDRPDKEEPLRTLASFRRDARGLMFGQNLVPEHPGRVAVGDRIDVLQAGPANVRLLAAQPNPA